MEFNVVTALLLLLPLHLVTADYDVIKDYKGRECTRRCNNQDNGLDGTVRPNSGTVKYNFCFVNTNRDWGYCSPQPGITSYNKVCKKNHQCEKHGEDYYWCYTEDESWDYCSPPTERRSGSRLVDSDGFFCKDNCDSRGSTYTWCHSDNYREWGFCSKIQNLASNGKKCKDDSPCSKHDHYYNYCYTQGGGWYYCGDVESGRSEYRRNVPQCDFSSPSSRVDCGWSGIHRSQCESMGCCHDATYKDHYNCFYKQVDCAKLIDAADNSYTLETNGDCETGVKAWRYSAFTVNGTNLDLRKKRTVSGCPEQAHSYYIGRFNQRVDALTDELGNMPGQIDIFEPNNHNNPIQAVYRRRLNRETDTPIHRVEALRAVIRPHHINRNNRVNLPRNARQYMLEYLNGETEDEAFHLVGSELGGPGQFYNMVPGHRSVNRNFGTPGMFQENDWRSVERAMRQHLENHPYGRVEFNVLLRYPTDLNYGRPMFIEYCASLFDNSESLTGDTYYAKECFNDDTGRIHG
ncbi:unnamed protein product [Darwinula stevensoni]|uniref:P-type domain-containing protein n=1 Tax=Darwinula stevensoni TaxID=69355 RepID=A0A7R9AB21_9CRUS|nr:unnamed protein product [Darwinula stevensoni]CAG0898956.1 unnamed protein product [Darwinula stevensoni]